MHGPAEEVEQGSSPVCSPLSAHGDPQPRHVWRLRFRRKRPGPKFQNEIQSRSCSAGQGDGAGVSSSFGGWVLAGHIHTYQILSSSLCFLRAAYSN